MLRPAFSIPDLTVPIGSPNDWLSDKWGSPKVLQFVKVELAPANQGDGGCKQRYPSLHCLEPPLGPEPMLHKLILPIAAGLIPVGFRTSLISAPASDPERQWRFEDPCRGA